MHFFAPMAPKDTAWVGSKPTTNYKLPTLRVSRAPSKTDVIIEVQPVEIRPDIIAAR
jgi:hypothetical protein